jgi:ADP-dependent NAD(P)H-hydrate dehydratase / NAD(P)H-hydrate epimerase
MPLQPSPTHTHPLFDTAQTRFLEHAALPQNLQPSLMQRAGLACAQLARAIAPHAQRAWVLCGPGNNGGDGLEAAAHLAAAGLQVQISWLGAPERASTDTLAAWQMARTHGTICWDLQPPALQAHDVVLDALLGIGLQTDRPIDSTLGPLLHALYRSPAHCLHIDVPSGLDADTGCYLEGCAPRQTRTHHSLHTLSLLTLHPGLYTAQGRDAAGTIWLDDLGLAQLPIPQPTPRAWLSGMPPTLARAHASHKGSFGDVLVIGGQGLHAGAAMQGAAILAAMAALHHGAGRVFLHLLDAGQTTHLAQQPEIMLRTQVAALDQLERSTVACGCGGGHSVSALLPRVLERSARLVLDADALNALASDALLRQHLQARQRHGLPTVLTPHPLEAARLLHCSTQQVQAHRLQAAQTLADTFQCTVLLKGSGSIIASPGKVAHLNPTGNARLATGGTGDVLAGMLAAYWLPELDSHSAACHSAWRHGHAADRWNGAHSLTASALAQGAMH